MSKHLKSFLISVESFRDSVQGSNKSFTALNNAINNFKTNLLLEKGKKLFAKTPRKLREKIDLSKAKKGDRYLTKSGVIVIFEGPHHSREYPFGFHTKKDNLFLSYKQDGTYYEGEMMRDKDIVAKA